MIGKVAKCQAGRTGLICQISKSRKGLGKLLYEGICLDRGRIGQVWQSTNPELIGTLDNWVRLRYREIESEHVAFDNCTSTKRNLLT